MKTSIITSKKSLAIVVFAMLLLWVSGTQNAVAFFQEETQEDIQAYDQYKGEVLDSESKNHWSLQVWP
ncbi:hypothetical protein [Maribacter halichondriae]|uniref:hypothetical protein n=1 Tax=Maribacter halichondriae TaxID=2980554 RepID=UPI00235945EF|nr:hypothetical protein [Maribacter sp. Hal144]